MGYTWDLTLRLYKTRKPVPGTNARPVEEYDDDDDDEEDKPSRPPSGYRGRHDPFRGRRP